MFGVLRKVALVTLITLPISAGADGDVKEVDLSMLSERGMLMRVLTDGRPVWIAYRTKGAIQQMEKRYSIQYTDDPTGINKEYRSFNKDYLVVFGGCPEGDEIPAYYPDRGFVCLSSCGEFDMAGRPVNDCAGDKPMEVPIHHYKDEKTIVVPIHQDGNT
jgi:Rieske Fe-S protein